jgi:hypothetical protein
MTNNESELTNKVVTDGALEAVANSNVGKVYVTVNDTLDVVLDQTQESVTEILEGQDINIEALANDITLEAINETINEMDNQDEIEIIFITQKMAKAKAEAKAKARKVQRGIKSDLEAKLDAIKEEGAKKLNKSPAEIEDKADQQENKSKADKAKEKEQKEEWEDTQEILARWPNIGTLDDDEQKALIQEYLTEKDQKKKEEAQARKKANQAKKASRKQILDMAYGEGSMDTATDVDVYLLDNKEKNIDKKIYLKIFRIVTEKIQNKVDALKKALDAGKIDEIKAKYNIA